MKTYKRVIVESPYAGNVDLNLRYLRAAMRDCILRGEAPFASHGLYTQEGVLDDGNVGERTMGIEAGFAWRSSAEKTVFYEDLGWSNGMHQAVQHCQEIGHPYEVRSLHEVWVLK